MLAVEVVVEVEVVVGLVVAEVQTLHQRMRSQDQYLGFDASVVKNMFVFMTLVIRSLLRGRVSDKKYIKHR